MKDLAQQVAKVGDESGSTSVRYHEDETKAVYTIKKVDKCWWLVADDGTADS